MGRAVCVGRRDRHKWLKKNAGVSMKRYSLRLTLFFLTFLLGSCGLYVQRQINAELDQLVHDVGSRWHPNNVARYEDFSRSSRAIYAKYGRAPDAFDELLMSYMIALAGHLDRQTISEQEFNYLSSRMLTDIQLEKQKLALQREAIQAQRDLAWQQFWQQFWANYQQSFRSPVSCLRMDLGGGIATIQCY